MTGRTARIAAAAIVTVPLIGYPLVVGADGARFPSADDCVRKAPPGETAGSTSSSAAGTRRLRRSSCWSGSAASATSTPRCAQTACGRWKVLYDGIDSYAQGASSAAEARGAGLEAWLEIAPPG